MLTSKKYKKIINLTILIVIIFSFFGYFHKTNAETKWFYTFWTKEKGSIGQNVEFIGENAEENCKKNREAFSKNPVYTNNTVQSNPDNFIYTGLSECFEKNIPIPIAPQNTPQVDTDTTYTPLVDLPGMPASFDTKPSDTNECPFGEYFGIIFRLFLGIASVLAMIMIVMGGIEYMTSGLVSSKEAGRKKITNAVFGLILALASWTILNTLNPGVLSVCLNDLPEAKITIMDETELEGLSQDTGIPPETTDGCPEGFEERKKDNLRIWLCKKKTANGKTFSQNFVDLVNAGALAEGPNKIRFWGGAYRSENAQRILRIRYCNGNTTDEKAPCDPDTALPGKSNHQHGLAIDFSCQPNNTGNYKTVDLIKYPETKACFEWLKVNAPKYGFVNLKSETWHWSINGK